LAGFDLLYNAVISLGNSTVPLPLSGQEMSPSSAPSPLPPLYSPTLLPGVPLPPIFPLTLIPSTDISLSNDPTDVDSTYKHTLSVGSSPPITSLLDPPSSVVSEMIGVENIMERASDDLDQEPERTRVPKKRGRK